ncbi:MAG: hypothetical protein ACD_65C00216G0010 [uncultured bacterium]|nr:MAG: hypothetical protein ACD_65C00216G0010 [uncultured bacterium]OGJ48574.1 MAG: DNA repair protein RecO [Candidatus Peregrinibacteria bacterium RIFOXYB12_FULL_41_12]OGJ48665.1 MAG: DNA repair protein RecO [Candidatus Peregrinibacteria bacterium RIFOXYA2_FULL_41_18]OGJ52455.1 MAG: DNA repair protein RecO [Candidatus Peregrinibacteria bacterium RIFOXYC2_FULL_41_22]OGJ55298.1 MAG: DNA repair protein RecO [Candidatus Peregrinibacteria bacterium RIFOXYB2_FULL_41_88]
MRTLQIKGIIISKRDLGEQDRVFNILTEREGKVEIIAKNTRNGTSTRNGHLELFNYATFFLYKSENHTYLNQCQTINEFPRLKSNLDTISTTYFAIEILDKLTAQNDPDENIFSLTLGFLKNIDENPYKAGTLLIAFKTKLLNEMGLLPTIIECGGCGNRLAPELIYAPQDHKFYCKNCRLFTGSVISPQAIKLFYFMQKNPLPSVLKLKRDNSLAQAEKELTTLLDIYLQENLGRELKSHQALN